MSRGKTGEGFASTGKMGGRVPELLLVLGLVRVATGTSLEDCPQLMLWTALAQMAQQPYRVVQHQSITAFGFVTGKSLDNPERGNVDQMSENVEKVPEKCPKIVRRG